MSNPGFSLEINEVEKRKLKASRSASAVDPSVRGDGGGGDGVEGDGCNGDNVDGDD